MCVCVRAFSGGIQGGGPGILKKKMQFSIVVGTDTRAAERKECHDKYMEALHELLDCVYAAAECSSSSSLVSLFETNEHVEYYDDAGGGRRADLFVGFRASDESPTPAKISVRGSGLELDLVASATLRPSGKITYAFMGVSVLPMIAMMSPIRCTPRAMPGVKFVYAQINDDDMRRFIAMTMWIGAGRQNINWLSCCGMFVLESEAHREDWGQFPSRNDLTEKQRARAKREMHRAIDGELMAAALHPRRIAQWIDDDA